MQLPNIIGFFNIWIIYLRREPEAKRNNIKAGKQIPFLSKMNCILISSCFGSCKQWFYPFNPYSSLLTLLRWIMFLNEFSLVIFCTNLKHFVLQKCLFFFRQQKHSLIVKLITSKQTLLKGAEFKMSSS